MKKESNIFHRHEKLNKKKIALEKYCGVIELKDDPLANKRNYAMNGNRKNRE
jgi:hypothetical protein